MGIPLAAPGFNVVVRERLSSGAPPRDQMGSLGSARRMPGEILMRERSGHGGSLGWLVLSSVFFFFFLVREVKFQKYNSVCSVLCKSRETIKECDLFCMCMYVCACAYEWRSEANPRYPEVQSFHPV